MKQYYNMMIEIQNIMARSKKWPCLYSWDGTPVLNDVARLLEMRHD